jgi:hypothetical protein
MLQRLCMKTNFLQIAEEKFKLAKAKSFDGTDIKQFFDFPISEFLKVIRGKKHQQLHVVFTIPTFPAKLLNMPLQNYELCRHSFGKTVSSSSEDEEEDISFCCFVVVRCTMKTNHVRKE